MTKYKVLKDIPGAKAGDIVEADTEFGDATLGDNPDSTKAVWIYPSSYPEFFEEIKEDECNGWAWRPKEGSRYRKIVFDDLITECIMRKTGDDNAAMAIGNCFKTEEQAKDYTNYLCAIAGIMQDARDDAINVSETFHSDNVAAVCLVEAGDVSVLLEGGALGIRTRDRFDDATPLAGIYFKNRDAAMKSLREHRSDWIHIAFYDFCRKGERVNNGKAL